MKSSDLFVRALEHEGVEYIFGVPGEENLDFLESLRTSSIKLVINRHEQAAGFMAATYGRLTGKPGVCLTTLGPGATNLMTAVAYANLGGMPMVIITGQKPVRSSKQGLFQMINVIEMMHPIVKYTHQITDADMVPSIVREAFRIAEERRPGAAHIEFPEDIAKLESDATLFNKSNIQYTDAHPESIKLAAEMINDAKCPLILIGAAANRKPIAEALSEFIDKTQIPFFNTQMGKGVVDEGHPLFLGTAALSDHDYIHAAIEYSDLIINVGHDVIEKPPFFMQHSAQKVIHINFTTSQVDQVYFPQVEVVGRLAGSISSIGNLVRKKDGPELNKYIEMKKLMESHIQERSEFSDFPIKPQRIVAEVRKTMPRDGIIALDNGVYKIWFARNYKAYEPNTVLLDNSLASMGAGLPSAMAARIVHPDKKVVAICGDGGFMMNSQEMETAVRLKLDLIVLILRDDAYGMIKWKQMSMGYESFGLDFNNPDFVKYADAYGAFGHRIDSTDALGKVLKSCLNSNGVHLIDVPVDYSENERVLIEEIRSITSDIFPNREV